MGMSHGWLWERNVQQICSLPDPGLVLLHFPTAPLAHPSLNSTRINKVQRPITLPLLDPGYSDEDKAHYCIRCSSQFSDINTDSATCKVGQCFSATRYSMFKTEMVKRNAITTLLMQEIKWLHLHGMFFLETKCHPYDAPATQQAKWEENNSAMNRLCTLILALSHSASQGEEKVSLHQK